jgi:methylenetetrahydrofolate reductase (NADPH)
MKPDSKLASKINGNDFIVTAEYMPPASCSAAAIESIAKSFDSKITAVNVSDNHFGVALSSLAASAVLSRAGIEPVLQMVTRDRNRIAIQSDLMGAACLGIKNVLCLTGYHQSLTGSPEAANVFDIDSIQFVAAVKQMNDAGTLLDGNKIEGGFSMLVGAVINPNLNPLKLNMIRLTKKINAGASFIQTQAVFDVDSFQKWFNAAAAEGLASKAAILAGVMPLASAAEAKKLRDTYTDYIIPDAIVDRLNKAGSEDAQKKEGIAICAEIINKLKNIKGLRGVHILSGGNEGAVAGVISAAGL